MCSKVQYLQVDETFNESESVSKRLKAVRERNSERVTRNCKICGAVLSETNPLKDLCRPHAKNKRLANLNRITTKDASLADDMDFDN